MLLMPRVIPALILLLCLRFSTVVWGQKTPPAAEMQSTVTLSELRERARPLLIFAPTAKDMRLIDQRGVVQANQKAAEERKLVAIAVPEKGEVSLGKTLNGGEAEKARQRFHVSRGEFVVVLVGKDGGEKLRSTRPLPFKRLTDAIDGMPMRKEEMKDKAR